MQQNFLCWSNDSATQENERLVKTLERLYKQDSLQSELAEFKYFSTRYGGAVGAIAADILVQMADEESE